MTRLILAILLTAATSSATAAATMYRYDTVHSQILVTVSHDGFSNPVARLHIRGGWLRFDPDHWQDASTELDIDTTSLDLGDRAWNDAVKGRRFLDTARWPQAHFVSTSVEPTGTDTCLLHGTLTLHGVSRPVTVSVRFNRRAFTIFGAHTVAGFSGRAVLDRTQFGMTSNTGSVSREVDVRLEIEAIADPQARNHYESSGNTAHAAEK